MTCRSPRARTRRRRPIATTPMTPPSCASASRNFATRSRRRLAGELTEDEFSPLRLMNGALSAAPRLYAARRHSLRHAVVGAVAQARRISRDRYDRATAISPPGRTCSSTGQAGGRARHSRGRSPRSTCTPSRPGATASATSPPTISRAPPPTRSKTRGSRPSSCASGRPCTRNSSFLPRKFKIAVTGARARPRGDQGA